MKKFNNKPKQQCKHKNIIMMAETSYYIPQGWDKLQQQDDIDMTDYFADVYNPSYKCLDCEEQLQ